MELEQIKKEVENKVKNAVGEELELAPTKGISASIIFRGKHSFSVREGDSLRLYHNLDHFRQFVSTFHSNGRLLTKIVNAIEEVWGDLHKHYRYYPSAIEVSIDAKGVYYYVSIF